MKTLREYIKRYPKLSAFLAVMLILAILTKFFIGEYNSKALEAIVIVSLLAIGFTIHRWAGVVVAAFCAIVIVYQGVKWYRSLQPTIEYSKMLDVLSDQNTEAAKLFNPVAAQQSVVIGGLQVFVQKSAQATEKRVRAALVKQSADSIVMDSVVEADFLKVGTDIQKAKRSIEAVMDSAGITLPGKTRQAQAQTQDTVVIELDVTDNNPETITVPPSSILTLEIDSAWYMPDVFLSFTYGTSQEFWCDGNGLEASAKFTESNRVGDYIAANLNRYALIYREFDGDWQPLRMGANVAVVNDSPNPKEVELTINDVQNGFDGNQGVVRIKREIRFIPDLALN
jgi:hypothetical protein